VLETVAIVHRRTSLVHPAPCKPSPTTPGRMRVTPAAWGRRGVGVVALTSAPEVTSRAVTSGR
jgi:hypothetical protein